MGFLDSLFSKSAKKLASDLTRTAVDAISNELSDTLRSNIQQHSNTSATVSEPVRTVSRFSTYEDWEADEKLRHVLSTEFSQYEVREGVSPTTIGGTGNFLPYTFGVYENGTPRLFIMVVFGNTCASREYRWSKEEAEKNNIPMINFVYAFSNEKDYVTNRLHQYL